MRTPMVTRSFKATVVNALFVNVDTKETFEKSFTLPRTFKTEREIEKAVKKTGLFEGNEKLVTILNFEHKTEKYAMSEQDFITHATQTN